VTAERVVLVTGAARGIGREIAVRFAAAGANIVVNDLVQADTADTIEAVEELGRRALGYGADIGEGEQVEAMLAAAYEALGPVSVVVNNAAFYDFGCATEQTEEAWLRTWGVDVTGVFHTTRAALPHMRDTGGGVIVNIASANAYFTIPQNTTYAAAKAGLVGLTRGLALELGPRGIRVVAVSPGFTRTPAVQAYLDDLSEERRQDEMGGYYAECPIGRLVEPEEIADACVFLASPAASFVTGVDLPVDGGMYAVNKSLSYNP
jgi:NAD(P)-dependent dehydrogenase (short-subunit alcohol dehydrogenase family)